MCKFQAVIPERAGIHYYSNGLVVLDAGFPPRRDMTKELLTSNIVIIINNKSLKRHFTVGFVSLDLSAMFAEHGYSLLS